MDIYHQHESENQKKDISEIKHNLLKPKEIKAKLDEYVIGKRLQVRSAPFQRQSAVQVFRGI